MNSNSPDVAPRTGSTRTPQGWTLSLRTRQRAIETAKRELDEMIVSAYVNGQSVSSIAASLGVTGRERIYRVLRDGGAIE